MRIFSSFAAVYLALAVTCLLSSTAPAAAQDVFGNAGVARTLFGTSNGTLAPQGSEASAVEGINTAGTAKVNNLANLEALLNIVANGMQILGIAWGGPTMVMGFMQMATGSQESSNKVLVGVAGVAGGLAAPGCIGWLVSSAQESALFNS
ncbi:hypothetical protein BH11CYA1_BH11CYA1_20150 [soil metagenome]